MQVVKAALEAGKPVLCEKPLGMNVREAEEMIRVAKDKGVFLMEAVWSRFTPAYAKVSQVFEFAAIFVTNTMSAMRGE